MLGRSGRERSREKNTVWRQAGCLASNSIFGSAELTRVLAAILPVKDSAGGLNGPRRRSSRGAQPKRTPTGVADSPLRGLEDTAEARRDFVTKMLTLTDSVLV